MAQTREAALAYLCGQLAHALADATNDPDLLVKVGEKVAQIEEQGDPYPPMTGALLAPAAGKFMREDGSLEAPSDVLDAGGFGYSVWSGSLGPSPGVEEFINHLKALKHTYLPESGEMLLTVQAVRSIAEYVWFPDGWTPDGEQA